MTRKAIDNREVVARAQEEFGPYSERIRSAVSSGQVAVALREIAHTYALSQSELADKALDFLSKHRLAGQYEEAS